MQKGDPINIKEISNGIMIKPSCGRPGECIADKEIIAFDSADKFIEWIKTHFNIYEAPKWDDDKERITK